MTDAHAEMHERYDRINSLWGKWLRPVTEDATEGRVGEVVRWCREKLGGRDEDLVGPERWGIASREGWSEQATYACLPSWGTNWARYVHEMVHYIYLMLPARFGSRNYDNHSPEHARLELELTDLVVAWLADEAVGIKRKFPRLVLSRPPDLRAASPTQAPLVTEQAHKRHVKSTPTLNAAVAVHKS